MEKTMRCKILAISNYDWESAIRRRLDLAGYPDDELHFFTSGLEGLAAAEQSPPDFFIYGLFTLDLDGYEFCRRLKWIPALQDVPVLLVDWISADIVYPRAQQAGAAGYLCGAIHSQGLTSARDAFLRDEVYYPPEALKATTSDTAPDLEGVRVLVIDDNPAMAAITHMTLGRGRNDEVRYADSGRKGLAAARQTQPDLIILDIMMPGWDGFETYRQFHMTSGLEDVPVIFQTAYAKAFQEAQNLGTAGCLLVPYKAPDLIAARDAAVRGETYVPQAG
jgi:CheY-like chemotaxis protein